MPISKIARENPNSKSWVKGEFKDQDHIMDPITYRLTSLSFHAGHPIPGIWLLLFQFSTLEVQGQCHSSRSHNASKYPINSYPFPSMSTPIPEIWLFQNLTLKIQDQSHGWGKSTKPQSGSDSQSTHIHFVPCESAIPFLGYSFFEIWHWK